VVVRCLGLYIVARNYIINGLERLGDISDNIYDLIVIRIKSYNC
jgi:hypothetical protein